MVRWIYVKDLKGDTNMLQGTLDVFSLDEVLGLLSGANKSGVLNITGDRGVGSVSIADGQLVAGSASSAPEAAELSDAVFELLRYEEGSFSFDGAAEAVGEPHDLETVMADAHSRLDEWKSIEAVVPSLDHHVTLAPTLTTSQVTLSESEWAAVVAVGEGATAGVVARRLGLGEFAGSKRIKALVERSLASLEASAASTPVKEAEPVVAPVFETPDPAPASFADVEVPAVEAPVAEAPVADDPVAAEPTAASVEASMEETAILEAAVVDATPAEIATDFSLDTVAPDAPAFGDSALSGFAPDAEIPPMPEAPAFGSFGDVDTNEGDIPPMPEPPSSFAGGLDVPAPPASFAGDFDAPAPPVNDAPSTFGGLDPLAGADMFEEPLRAGDRASDAFDASDMISETAMDAPMPPPPGSFDAPLNSSMDDAAPSFAPPADFDADAFAMDDAPAAAAEAADDAADASGEEKGGSLLMRYLKSNG